MLSRGGAGGAGSSSVPWLPLALAGALAFMTFWLGQLGRLSLPTDMGGFGHEPDYIVENFQATAFDEKGLPRHVLTANKLTHYMDDDTARIESPLYTQYVPDRPEVSVKSRRALLSPGGDHVYFLDDVHMVRAATADRAAMVLNTEYLHVTPDAKRMQTDRGVTVHQAGSSIAAGAMMVEGQENSILFSQRVRSVYENAISAKANIGAADVK